MPETEGFRAADLLAVRRPDDASCPRPLGALDRRMPRPANATILAVHVTAVSPNGLKSPIA